MFKNNFRWYLGVNIQSGMRSVLLLEIRLREKYRFFYAVSMLMTLKSNF